MAEKHPGYDVSELKNKTSTLKGHPIPEDINVLEEKRVLLEHSSLSETTDDPELKPIVRELEQLKKQLPVSPTPESEKEVLKTIQGIEHRSLLLSLTQRETINPLIIDIFQKLDLVPIVPNRGDKFDEDTSFVIEFKKTPDRSLEGKVAKLICPGAKDKSDDLKLKAVISIYRYDPDAEEEIQPLTLEMIEKDKQEYFLEFKKQYETCKELPEELEKIWAKLADELQKVLKSIYRNINLVIPLAKHFYESPDDEQLPSVEKADEQYLELLPDLRKGKFLALKGNLNIIRRALVSGIIESIEFSKRTYGGREFTESISDEELDNLAKSAGLEVINAKKGEKYNDEIHEALDFIDCPEQKLQQKIAYTLHRGFIDKLKGNIIGDMVRKNRVALYRWYIPY